MLRTASLALLAGSLLGVLVATALAAAKAPPKPRPAQVEVGRAHLAQLSPARAALLVAVRYPIEMKGRRAELRLRLLRPDGTLLRGLTLRARLSAGAPRIPDRRRGFTFVHHADLAPALARRLDGGARVEAVARAVLDVDRDGRPELRRGDSATRRLSGAGGGATCASLPHLHARPGRTVSVPLPPCRAPIDWATPAGGLEHGRAWIRDGRLHYRAPRRFRGTEAVPLVRARRSAAGSAATRRPRAHVVPITVGTAHGAVVRALGDSVTAGFGYYADGRPMSFSSLLECRPPESGYDDACSSNSLVTSNSAAKVEYAPDYGLSNNVSWTAQWANEHGIADFKNFAVSGSEPSDWFGKGQFAATTRQLASEDPDYVLLTVGANPLLSNMLFGLGNIGCGIWADVFGRFRECVEREFAAIRLRENLQTLYTNLVRETDARILVMQYHLSIPTAALYGVEQIAAMGALMNQEIESVAQEVSPARITVVSPPHFDVGLSLGQAYPSQYRCEGEFLTSIVDGPSVQASISQSVLGDLHPLEFCAGEEGQAPWVISADTGIHPSAAGYTQMASRLPAPQS